MDKLLEIGVWRQFALNVLPSALFAGSLFFLLGLQKDLPREGPGLWLTAATFVLVVALLGVLLEEAAGRFESKVDSSIYPRFRSLRKFWSAMYPLRRVKPDTYMHRFNVTWDKYLDLAPPDPRPIRWDYYNSLVHRYRVVISLGISVAATSLVWLAFDLFASPKTGFVLPKSPAAFLVVGASLGVVAIYMLVYETPSSAGILHWHRIRLIRSLGGSGGGKARPPASGAAWLGHERAQSFLKL